VGRVSRAGERGQRGDDARPVSIPRKETLTGQGFAWTMRVRRIVELDVCALDLLERAVWVEPQHFASGELQELWIARDARARREWLQSQAAAATQVAAGALHCPDMALGRSGDWPTRRHERTEANGGREAVVADMREAWNRRDREALTTLAASSRRPRRRGIRTHE